MAEDNFEVETEGSAIAAFTLAQFAFWGLIESGVISTEKAADMLETFDRFWANLETFRPREFIAETLSLKGSADLYVAGLKDAAGRAVTRAAPSNAQTLHPAPGAAPAVS